jgi:hypothetical protein
MPLVKLTCPKCRATLRPAKPVPEGKSVKCPKCEEVFRAGEEPADTRTRPDAPAKKPAAAPAAKAAEEDEEAETYAVIRDEDQERKAAEEAERRKRRGRKRRARDEDDEDEDDEDEGDLGAQLLKNLKTRDPRGAAQGVVVTPSNWLLRTGILGFFAWVVAFIVFMLPIAFPNIPDNPDEKNQIAVGKDKDKEKDKKPAQKGLAEQIQERAWTVVLFIAVLFLGLTQAALITFGAVRMQSLESYGWSMAGCILAILPLYMVPVWALVWWVFEFIYDDAPWAFACIVYAWGPLVGGFCLKQLLNPKVKPGFEYRPA